MSTPSIPDVMADRRTLSDADVEAIADAVNRMLVNVERAKLGIAPGSVADYMADARQSLARQDRAG